MSTTNSYLIEEVNRRCVRLMAFISRGRLRDDPMFGRVLSRFGKGKILGMRPGGDAAYTIDKGREIRLCVPDEYELDTATFVMLHELAHVGTEETGHPPAFWKNFARILEVAVAAGVYSFQDFSKDRPGQYCGKKITYQPLRNGGERPQRNFNRGKYALVETIP